MILVTEDEQADHARLLEMEDRLHAMLGELETEDTPVMSCDLLKKTMRGRGGSKFTSADVLRWVVVWDLDRATQNR